MWVKVFEVTDFLPRPRTAVPGGNKKEKLNSKGEENQTFDKDAPGPMLSEGYIYSGRIFPAVNI